MAAMTNEKNLKPLVSCIIIFFNAEQFFVEAIESIFAQSYDNWELILADDGSTDKSTMIAQQYVQKYPDKVRYVEHEGHQNRGMSPTRNLGIRNTKGKYIGFLDSDDFWLPQKLEQQVAIMEGNPEAAMVYGRSLHWRSWTNHPDDSQKDYMPELGIKPNILYRLPTIATLCYPLGKAVAPCLSNFLVRREIIEQVGGFEEGFGSIYQLYEDQAFLSKVYLVGAVFVANEYWDRYRLHPNSCVAKAYQNNNYYTVRLFFLNWLEKYIAKQNIQYPEVAKALQQALWPYRHPMLYKISTSIQLLVGKTKKFTKTIAREGFPTRIRQWLKLKWSAMAKS